MDWWIGGLLDGLSFDSGVSSDEGDGVSDAQEDTRVMRPTESSCPWLSDGCSETGDAGDAGLLEADVSGEDAEHGVPEARAPLSDLFSSAGGVW